MSGPEFLFNPQLKKPTESFSRSKKFQVTELRKKELRSSLLEAVEAGEVSRQTNDEILGSLDKLNPGQSRGLNSLFSIFQAEKEGTSKSGRARVATQKLFETVIDQPGRRQTLLTPRSNTSRGIVGV